MCIRDRVDYKFFMPKEIKDLKVFLNHLRASKALDSTKKTKEAEKKQPRNKFQKRILIKKNRRVTKFKLRTSKYLYTFKANKSEVIKKIMSSIPSDVNKTDLSKKSK